MRSDWSWGWLFFSIYSGLMLVWFAFNIGYDVGHAEVKELVSQALKEQNSKVIIEGRGHGSDATVQIAPKPPYFAYFNTEQLEHVIRPVNGYAELAQR